MTNDVVHMGRLWKDGAYTEPGRWVKAEDYERLEADAAGVRAELASVKLARHRLQNDLTAARLENERLQARVTRYQGRCDALAILHYGPDPNAVEPNPAQVDEIGGWRCDNCQEWNLHRHSHCVKCSAKKSDEHPQCSVANMWQCGSCRTFNPLLDQRCQKCGTVYVADWRAQKSSEPEPPKEVSNPGVRCKATYRGKLCCRPEGHDGEHIATGASANMRW